MPDVMMLIVTVIPVARHRPTWTAQPNLVDAAADDDKRDMCKKTWQQHSKQIITELRKSDLWLNKANRDFGTCTDVGDEWPSNAGVCKLLKDCSEFLTQARVEIGSAFYKHFDFHFKALIKNTEKVEYTIAKHAGTWNEDEMKKVFYTQASLRQCRIVELVEHWASMANQMREFSPMAIPDDIDKQLNEVKVRFSTAGASVVAYAAITAPAENRTVLKSRVAKSVADQKLKLDPAFQDRKQHMAE